LGGPGFGGCPVRDGCFADLITFGPDVGPPSVAGAFFCLHFSKTASWGNLLVAFGRGAPVGLGGLFSAGLGEVTGFAS